VLHDDGGSTALWGSIRVVAAVGADQRQEPAAEVPELAEIAAPAGTATRSAGDALGPVAMDDDRRVRSRFVVREPGVYPFARVVRTADGGARGPARSVLGLTQPKVGKRLRGCDAGGASGSVVFSVAGVAATRSRRRSPPPPG
jgi:uncharacterized protein (TIGR03382 family)